MTLDEEFTRQTISLIEQTLKMYKDADASPRIGDVWQVKRAGDFLCGFFVGQMVGSALSAFQVFCHREPTQKEHMEIVGLVERYAAEISEFFAKFNPDGLK